MYILIFFQRSIALWSGEDLIIKVHFISCLKHIRTKKKKMGMLGKSPQIHKGIRNEVSVYEQKSIKINVFNEAEEKEIKECVKKGKIKTREAAENDKLFKKKEKKGP